MSTTPSSTVNTTLGNDSARTKTSAMCGLRAALALQLLEDELQAARDVAQRGLRALAVRRALFGLVGLIEGARGQCWAVGHERGGDGLACLCPCENVRVTDGQVGGHVHQRVEVGIDL